MKFHNYINKLSIKIALVITVLVIGLFTVLNFLIVDRGEKTFDDVYGIIIGQDTVLPPSNEPFFMPPNPNLPFATGQAGIKMTPREHFKTRFQSSLLIAGLLTLFGATGIGFLISRMVARPMNKLGIGMKKLRQSHYLEQLAEGDSEEFNSLIREFNSLVSELQRVEELRKNLISDTSHELRTPLTSLTAQLEGLADGVLVMDQERINLLRDQVSRLSEMTERLQDYAHLRSQTIRLHKNDFKLKETTNKIIGQYKTVLTDKKISFHQNFSDDYTLSADSGLFERILNNLMENAIRYSQAKNITISANKQKIVFTDDGVGIPHEHLQDIFERFFRLEKSRNRKTGGLGLGLAIVREIVEAHGWKIEAKLPENKKGLSLIIDLD
ncbi:MAG: ATP-binding protein [Patescibacteria group bacterium]|jgi:signal transduction histidine kinase